MKILTRYKGILMAIVLLLVVMFLYNLFFKSKGLVMSLESPTSSTGDDLLKIRQGLEAVTFDKTIFSSPSYLLLTDFSTAIPPQATGRPNPFDIIGRN